MIHSKFEENENPNNPFPKIMKSDYHIVLFIEPKVGIVLVKLVAHGYEAGVVRRDFVMNEFEDFNGTVELSNKIRK